VRCCWLAVCRAVIWVHCFWWRCFDWRFFVVDVISGLREVSQRGVGRPVSSLRWYSQGALDWFNLILRRDGILGSRQHDERIYRGL